MADPTEEIVVELAYRWMHESTNIVAFALLLLASEVVIRIVPVLDDLPRPLLDKMRVVSGLLVGDGRLLRGLREKVVAHSVRHRTLRGASLSEPILVLHKI